MKIFKLVGTYVLVGAAVTFGRILTQNVYDVTVDPYARKRYKTKFNKFKSKILKTED